LTGPTLPDGTDQFGTASTVDPAQAGEVLGVSQLAPGTYAFHCFLHTNLMQGRLIIEAAIA
jgi:plastocyanin